MKGSNFVLWLFVVFLAACGPTAAPEPASTPPTTAEVTDIIVPNSAVAPPEPDRLADSISPIAPPAPEAEDIDSGDEDQAQLNWSHDPDKLIFSATFCCGFTTPLVPMNYIPDASIWGDGRIIWVEYGDGGKRRVLAGKMTPEQIANLLQRAANDGFFTWNDRYANETIADAAEKCLTIEIEGQSKKVCEYVEGAPPAFHALYADIASGAGATGTAYVPERAYLTAFELDLPQDSKPALDFEWPAASLGFSLGQAAEGRWIEGEALEIAWQIVNARWHGMIVQDGDTFYEISVQVSGLSHVEPPAQ